MRCVSRRLSKFPQYVPAMKCIHSIVLAACSLSQLNSVAAWRSDRKFYLNACSATSLNASIERCMHILADGQLSSCPSLSSPSLARRWPPSPRSPLKFYRQLIEVLPLFGCQRRIWNGRKTTRTKGTARLHESLPRYFK